MQAWLAGFDFGRYLHRPWFDACINFVFAGAIDFDVTFGIAKRLWIVPWLHFSGAPNIKNEKLYDAHGKSNPKHYTPF